MSGSLRIAEIAADGYGSSAKGLALPDDLQRTCVVSVVVDRNICPGAGESERGRCAYAAARAGHQRFASRQYTSPVTPASRTTRPHLG